MTLIETLIASAMLLMMLGALYQTLVLGLRFYQKTRDAAEIQQETLKVVAQVQTSLQSANAGSLTVLPPPLPGPSSPRTPALIFVSAQSDDPYFRNDSATGKPLWQKFVCYYCKDLPDGRLSLIKSEIPISPAATTPPTLPDIATMMAAPKQQVLSEAVSGVNFGDSSSVLLSLSLTSSQQNGIRITSRVAARN